MKSTAGVLLPALVLFVLAGCSMNQSVVINPDGSGSADVRVVLGPLVVRYMEDILGSLGSGASNASGGPAFFDLGRIRRAFGEIEGVKLTELSSPSRSTLHLRLSFSDINSVFPVAVGTGARTAARVPLELTVKGGIKTLHLLLSRETWPAISALSAFRNDPLLASLGPQERRHYTETEYLNLLEYAFADYAGKEKVREAVIAAAINIKITVNGTIVSESGGTRDGNTVVFHIPLIKMVTLEQPIDLSVSFR